MKAGIQITCTEGHEICKVGPRGLRVGTKLDSRYFTDWKTQPFKNGEQVSCRKCGAPFIESHSQYGMRVMTPDGWRYADRLIDRYRQHEIRNGIEGIR
jgi:hypothetical protein